MELLLFTQLEAASSETYLCVPLDEYRLPLELSPSVPTPVGSVDVAAWLNDLPRTAQISDDEAQRGQEARRRDGASDG